MKSLWMWIMPLALVAGLCAMLRADDAPAPANEYDQANQSLWFIEHSAAMARDAEDTGVQAVFQADALLKTRDPQVAVDFFNKMLFDTKSRIVQRAIRLKLSEHYAAMGQNDKAMEQLQILITDQE